MAMSLASRASGLGRLDRSIVDNTTLNLPDVMRQSSNDMLGYNLLAYAEDSSGPLRHARVCCWNWCFEGELYHGPRDAGNRSYLTSVNRILTCCAYGLL